MDLLNDTLDWNESCFWSLGFTKAGVLASTNLEAKSISTKLKISDRVECIARTRAFLTLKDHKDNFHSNPTCRLINPSKTNLEK